MQLLDEQGTVYWSTSVTGQSYLDAQPQTKFQRLTYRLLSVSPDAAYQSFSNTSSVDQGFQFSFPTAFTPNNDGLNDVFRPVGAPFASSFILQVLNRWGQIIFESKDPKAGWDGTHRGKPAPPETYIYRMEAVDVNGKKITQKGTVTLIR
nr:gliding motility-associated C-terminal domain-containing protein [Rufibacter sediminis]